MWSASASKDNSTHKHAGCTRCTGSDQPTMIHLPLVETLLQNIAID